MAVAVVAVALIVCRHLGWEKAVGTESDPAFVHLPLLQLLATIMAAKHDAFVADFAITIDSFLPLLPWLDLALRKLYGYKALKENY